MGPGDGKLDQFAASQGYEGVSGTSNSIMRAMDPHIWGALAYGAGCFTGGPCVPPSEVCYYCRQYGLVFQTFKLKIAQQTT